MIGTFFSLEHAACACGRVLRKCGVGFMVIQVCLLLATTADARPSPASLAGPYDLLGITGAAEDAALPPGPILNISLQRSRDTLGGHTTALVYSGEVPFGESATFKIQSLCEAWDLSSGDHGSGIGEVAVTARFLLCRETNAVPTLTFKLGMKTAAGGGSSMRYTDSMGALFGLMASRDFHFGSSNTVRKIRVLAEIGLGVWDDGVKSNGSGEQNDAPKYALGIEFKAHENLTVRGGIHGLNGWRADGDSPLSANAGVEYVVSDRASACLNADLGLRRDADDYIISGGMKVRFGSRD